MVSRTYTRYGENGTHPVRYVCAAAADTEMGT
jgi:hypothetical protein